MKFAFKKEPVVVDMTCIADLRNNMQQTKASKARLIAYACET